MISAAALTTLAECATPFRTDAFAYGIMTLRPP